MGRPDAYPPQSYPATRNSEIHRKIFDATIEVFEKSGYSNTNTNRIANQAGISVGSIYLVFPNKLAIFKAMAEHYNSSIEHAALEFLQSEDSARPWYECVDRIIDRLAEFYRENPKLARWWTALVGNPEVQEISQPFDEWAVKSLASYLAIALPEQRPVKVLRISRMFYWSTLDLLERSVSENLKLNREIVDQAKIMIKAYLSTLIVAPPLPIAAERVQNSVEATLGSRPSNT
jgi:AcrR family transcriptional regulator